MSPRRLRRSYLAPCVNQELSEVPAAANQEPGLPTMQRESQTAPGLLKKDGLVDLGARFKYVKKLGFLSRELEAARSGVPGSARGPQPSPSGWCWEFGFDWPGRASRRVEPRTEMQGRSVVVRADVVPLFLRRGRCRLMGL